MNGVGLYIEECLQEIVARFHASVADELKFAEPALRLAAPILLRDAARALRASVPAPEPWHRGVVLIAAQPPGGIRGLVREFALLRASLWDVLTERGHAVPASERRAADRFFDEALALAADRWANFVRLFVPAPLRVGEPPLAPSELQRNETRQPPPSPKPGLAIRPPPLPAKRR